MADSEKRYIFRLHEGRNPDSAEIGWVKTDGYNDSSAIRGIPDLLSTVQNTGKIGTSIPTPLARIYLIKTAFEIAKEDGFNNQGSYAQLVSDTLDILQLIFEKGNQVKFHQWDRYRTIQDLKSSSRDAKNLLGESLEMAFLTAGDFPSQMTIIEYDGIVLGGLSPYTLVYPSANLRREVNERIEKDSSFDFSSNKRVRFCDEKLHPLSERPQQFKEYLYSMKALYGETFASGNPLFAFGEYVSKHTSKEGFIPREEVDKYEMYYAKFDEAPSINGIYLRYNVRLPDLQNSTHFMMAPSINDYMAYMSVAPLVLPEQHSQPGWKYVEEEWDIQTRILSIQCADTGVGHKLKQIANRYLPKNGASNREVSTIKYPWVSNCDFFQDYIIDLGYEINSEMYNYTLFTSDKRSFLLPIKKEYFLFFKREDLEKNLRMEPLYRNDELMEVKVSLVIPLTAPKGEIVLTRIYDKSKIYEQSPMGLGIFPFYQLDESKGLYNQYSVYLFDEKDHVNLEFYSQRGLSVWNETVGDGMSKSGALKTSFVHRTRLGSGNSKVYNLREEGDRNNNISNIFNFIEVKITDADRVYTAMIIPKWKYKDVGNNNNQHRKAIFAIDFGTSNTHIAYCDTDRKEVNPFTIGHKDIQMVLLNKPSTVGRTDYRNAVSFGPVAAMSLFLREFVPSVVGPDNAQGIKYPIKTASLNGSRFGTGELFGEVNIGFDYEVERVKLDSAFKYETDLKWAMEKNHVGSNSVESKRVYAYCEQTLWMIKNKLVEEGLYSNDIKIICFYPDSMSRTNKENFSKAWESARKNVFAKCGFGVDIFEELESVVPYYSLLKKDSSLLSYNSINVDIGGGTTDIFIFDRNNGYYGYEASVLFAGNNLWGQKEFQGTYADNGFVSCMEHKIMSGKVTIGEEIKKNYENIKSRSGVRSDDMAGFFFKNDALFGFSDTIRNEPKLRFILFLHYASIIYYVTDIIKYIRSTGRELEMPSRLTFTGKGSEYLKILSPKEEYITRLTYTLFHAFGIDLDEFVNGFSVLYPENPKELTAEGGLYKNLEEPEITVDFELKKEGVLMMAAPRQNSRSVAYYEQVGKHVLGFKTREGEVYMGNSVRQYAGDVMEHFNEFVDVLAQNNYVKNLLGELNILMEESDVTNIKQLAKRSFDVNGEVYQRKNVAGEPLTGNIFFLAMKDMLLDMSKLYAEEIKKKN